MKFAKEIVEHAKRTATALAMGGPKKVEKFKKSGNMSARERIDYFFDGGSFKEAGLFVKPENPDHREKAPGDGRITGFGKVNGRMVGGVFNDFTGLNATSAYFNSAKNSHIKEVCSRNGYPIVIMGEAAGARIPDNMGAAGFEHCTHGRKYVRLRDVPMADAITGESFGFCCWNACLSDFVAMKKGAHLAVASDRVCSAATKVEVDAEELSGWKLHAEITGLADYVAETDAECLDAIKRFLSYMPSNNKSLTPRAEVPEDSDEAIKNILDVIPEERAKVYDVKRVIRAIVDKDSMFELKPRFGRAIVCCLARIDGRAVGIIANNPYFNAGAMEYNASDKAISMMVLCDSFNIPTIFLVDQPGFMIGLDGERHSMPRKIINWMNALGMMTVPTFALQLRKNFGQGILNMGCTTGMHCMGAWWTAETSFMDPASALIITKGLRPEDNPDFFASEMEKIKELNSVYELGRVFGTHQIIDPRESRDYLKDMLEIHASPMSSIGKHNLSNWPTSY